MKRTIVTFLLLAVIGVMHLVEIGKRQDAERKLEMAQITGETVGYQKGLAAGINATIACVKIEGTNKPRIDLGDVLEYARTNK